MTGEISQTKANPTHRRLKDCSGLEGLGFRDLGFPKLREGIHIHIYIYIYLQGYIEIRRASGLECRGLGSSRVQGLKV